MVLLPSSQKAVESLELPPPSCATEEGNVHGTSSAEDKTTNETKGGTSTTTPKMRWEMNEDGAPSTRDETKGDTPTTPPGRERNEDGAPSTGFPKGVDGDEGFAVRCTIVTSHVRAAHRREIPRSRARRTPNFR